jgi:hypothetical protein
MGNLFEKHYTLEQANAMIPHVRRLFAEVRALLAPTGDNQASPLPSSEMHENGYSNGNGHTNGHGNGNGNGAAEGLAAGAEEAVSSSGDYSTWSEEKRHEAAYRLLNALQSQGIVIQDVERGLIDFPSLQDGREIFLCYELNDGLSIQFFHETDAGYAGRQPITEMHE